MHTHSTAQAPVKAPSTTAWLDMLGRQRAPGEPANDLPTTYGEIFRKALRRRFGRAA
jgi:hypothetical protein